MKFYLEMHRQPNLRYIYVYIRIIIIIRIYCMHRLLFSRGNNNMHSQNIRNSNEMPKQNIILTSYLIYDGTVWPECVVLVWCVCWICVAICICAVICWLGSSNVRKISHRHQVSENCAAPYSSIAPAHPRNENSKHCWQRNYDEMGAPVDMLFNNHDVLGWWFGVANLNIYIMQNVWATQDSCKKNDFHFLFLWRGCQ